MKKLEVRFCLGYRDFELFDLCGLSKLRFLPVFGVEYRRRSGRKVVFGLIYHSLNGLLKIYWGDYFRIWNWPMRGSCLNSPFTALMMPMMAKTNRRSHAKPNAMPTMPASA